MMSVLLSHHWRSDLPPEWKLRWYKGVKPGFTSRKWVGLIEEVRRVHEGVRKGECDVASHLIRK